VGWRPLHCGLATSTGESSRAVPKPFWAALRLKAPSSWLGREPRKTRDAWNGMPSDLKGFAWPHGYTPKQILKRFNKFLDLQISGTNVTATRYPTRHSREQTMRLSFFTLAGTAFLSTCAIAVADDNGALTGAAGGAVTGAVVGGPVGAVVGGAAGAVIGGAATGSPQPVVVEPAPCASRTTTTTNNNTGASRTTQTTDCSN
jgi:hypothetical protein